MRPIRLLLCALCLVMAFQAAPCLAQDKAGELDGSSASAMLGPMDLVRLVARAKGKVTLLSFWASWCAPCRAEIPELNEVRRAFGEDELLMVGLSVDEDPLAYSKFVAATDFSYPVRRVTEAASSLYRIETIPRIVIYNGKGELVLSHEGGAPAQELKGVIATLLTEK